MCNVYMVYKINTILFRPHIVKYTHTLNIYNNFLLNLLLEVIVTLYSFF